MAQVKDEQEALKLDENFKQIMKKIEPHCARLTSPSEKRLCELWLKKLGSSSKQRQLRNCYLYTLHQQVRNNKLKGIFSKEPPDGPLAFQETKMRKQGYLSSSMNDLTDSTDSKKDSWRKGFGLLREDCSLQSSDSTDTRSDFFTDKEDFSASIDNFSCRSIVQELANAVRYLEHRNKVLKNKFKQHLDNCQGDKCPSVAPRSQGSFSESSCVEGRNLEILEYCTGQFNDEVSKLNGVFDEEQKKHTMINEQINKFIQKLEEKIRATEVEYTEKLKNIYVKFDALILEKDAEAKRKDNIIFNLKETILQKDSAAREEIQHLKEAVSHLEMKLQVKSRDGKKLQTMLAEQYANMKREFLAIRNDMKLTSNKCYDNLRLRVAALKKTIRKLEKSKNRAYHEYERKIAAILMEQSLQKKSRELQFKAQQSELSSLLNLEKQKEVDSIVNSLDEKCQEFLNNVKQVRSGSSKSCFSIPRSEDKIPMRKRASA